MQPQSSAMQFYGQRLALLGAVTKLFGAMIAEEEAARGVLVAQFTAEFHAAAHFKPFDPLRVGANAIESQEHEARWELAHDELDHHKSMWQVHVASMFRLTASLRDVQRQQRLVLEREATLRVVEFVCHWELDVEALYAVYVREGKVVESMVLKRKMLLEDEEASRDVLAHSEHLKRKAAHRQWNDFMAEHLPCSGDHP